jgi:hypothetical protein
MSSSHKSINVLINDREIAKKFLYLFVLLPQSPPASSSVYTSNFLATLNQELKIKI